MSIISQARVIIARWPSDGRRIYFVRCGKFIKIGTSSDPAYRLDALSTASPYELTLIGHIPGSMVAELALHDLLRRHHVKGEWFRANAALMRVVNDLLSKPPRPGYPISRNKAKGWRDIIAEQSARSRG